MIFLIYTFMGSALTIHVRTRSLAHRRRQRAATAVPPASGQARRDRPDRSNRASSTTLRTRRRLPNRWSTPAEWDARDRLPGGFRSRPRRRPQPEVIVYHAIRTTASPTPSASRFAGYLLAYQEAAFRSTLYGDTEAFSI
ncbi:MAG: hypothetical protein MZU97_01440 [Bacillus subtilis]|nr:hypothetical protein [Bacillus subtilis]